MVTQYNFYIWIKKFLFIAISSLAMGFCINGCSPFSSSYEGSWLGIDYNADVNIIIYEFNIEHEYDNNFLVTVIKYQYQPMLNKENAFQWTESDPKNFKGVYNEKDGSLRTEFGVVMYDANAFNLTYENLHFFKKAPNAEGKFKYVAKEALQKNYPTATIID